MIRAAKAEISAPEHLNSSHDLSAFDSGVAALDEWLKRRALANERTGASRTYVVSAENKVIGYYALATGAVGLRTATGRARRNTPEPIPVMVLGRLAVDERHQGMGLGRGMLRDAILRTLQAAAIGGIRAIVVHAVSEDAKRFYERSGFASSPLEPLTLMITVTDAERALSER